MKIKSQIIYQNGAPWRVALTPQDYQLIVDNLVGTLQIEAEGDAIFAHNHSALHPDLRQKLAAGGANAIQILRTNRNLSQAKLAKATSVSRQYIFQLENNQRQGKLSVLKKIAAVLEVSLADLIGGNDLLTFSTGHRPEIQHQAPVTPQIITPKAALGRKSTIKATATEDEDWLL